MTKTRYSEARTLVRRIRRLPGQSKAEFKANVLRLRKHFKQFNVDVSEICQWLMGLRPGGKKVGQATEEFWKFFLEPENFLSKEDDPDRYRLIVFDIVSGIDKTPNIAGLSLPDSLKNSISASSAIVLSPTAQKLFERIAKLEEGHRLILLKAAAEWVVARYQRGVDNWKRQHEEWEKEKNEWEKNNPGLTEPSRKQFNQIFKELGIRDKNPRVCPWERLNQGKDNCIYPGEMIGKIRHAPLCRAYKNFSDIYKKDEKLRDKFKKNFTSCAEKYLKMRKNQPFTPKPKIVETFLKNNPSAKWFPEVWKDYLIKLKISEDTILGQYNGNLPHCIKFGDDIKECEHNQHTELCKLYRNHLDPRPELQALEALYRDWRKVYVRGPAKPSFKYPSKRSLPMPKIFGKGFFRADFDKSILYLRLEDMPQGEFLPFGFVTWPKKYRPQPKDQDTEINSVHVNFIGTRARAGFRFLTPHKNSRFSICQDELDYLRSRKYPRQAQDQKFLDEARELLLESFEPGCPEQNLKMLSVDLGTSGAAAAYFKGKSAIYSKTLKVVKLDKNYESYKSYEESKKVQAGKGAPAGRQDKQDKKQEKDKAKKKGLSKDHVGLHIEAWSKEAKKIAEKRQDKEKKKKVVIRSHDMRGLVLHTGWMLRDWARLNASQIIKISEEKQVDLIVFESMRGEKQPGYDELNIDEKQRKAFWSYGRIRHKVVEKAVERGMRVITVPKFKSSQVCSQCGKEQEDKNRLRKNKNSKEHVFECEFKGCNYKTGSDENAARVLGRVFWGEITLPDKEKDGA